MDKVAGFDDSDQITASPATNGHGTSAATLPMTPASAPDRFDLNRLRLSQNFAATVGVKKILTTVPVRKPNRQEFVRVHSDPGWQLPTAVLESKQDREVFLVDPTLVEHLGQEVSFKILYTAITRQDVLFLWPVRLPGPDGRLDDWSRSACEAADHAMHGWVRIIASMSLGAYEVYRAEQEHGDPNWPDTPFQEIVRIAFKDRFIDSLDHPMLRRLRGEL